MRCLIFLLILFQATGLHAQLNQQYSFRHIDQNDGLLHNNVKSIGQDKRGFVWILTYNGLQRYDGSRFVNYPEITRNSSFGMIKDSELYLDTARNEIRIAKVDHSEKLNLSDNRLTQLSLSENLNTDGLFPTTEFKDQHGREWRIGLGGVISFIPNQPKSKMSFININPGQFNRNTYVIQDYDNGQYLMQNFNCLFIIDPKTKTAQSSLGGISDHPLLKQIWEKFGKDIRIRFLLQDSYHNIWISTWTADLIRYNQDDQQMTTYSLRDLNRKHSTTEQGDITLLVQAMYEDRQQNLWLATDFAGLMRYNRQKDDFDFIISNEKIANGIRYNFSIYSIFQDRDDNIWLGTDRGISIFNPYHDQIRTIRHVDGFEASLPKQGITDIIDTGVGEILVATWGGGITIYNQNWDFQRTIKFDGPDEYNLVWSFAKTNDGMIWAGTQQGYIHLYDPKQHSFHTIRPEEMDNSTIVKIMPDHNGNLVFGLHSGKMVVWNEKENKYYRSSGVDSLTSQAFYGITHMLEDAQDRCWMSTAEGLVEFDIEQHKIVKVYQPEKPGATTGSTIVSACLYNDSTLLISVIYRGIYLFNLNTNAFSRLPALQSLEEASVYAIQRDAQGQFWLTANYKLYQFNPANGQLKAYPLDRVAMNASFEATSFTQLSDGTWATSTAAEIISFDPRQLGKDKNQFSKVEISRFSVGNQPLYIDTFLTKHQPVILPYNQNFISIEFASLDFMHTRETNYYYRLAGIEREWIHSTSKQFADYTDLKPGDYVFEVKAQTGEGFSAITSLPIIINPPWWGTTWFQLSAIALTILSIFYLVRRRIQNIHKQAELKQRIVESEMMALRAQMNPHFIFNCLNSIDNLIQTDQKTSATNYLAKFAQLIRAILENSKSNLIPCWKDLDALKLYLEMEALRWDNKIQYQLNIDPQIQNGDYKVPPMVVQPFVENAIHHGLLNKLGKDKRLDIKVRIEDKGLKYTITDNGVGRVQAAAYKKLNHSSQQSFGMQLSRERIGLFNQDNHSIVVTDLYDDQKEACGTTVEVWLTMQPAMA